MSETDVQTSKWTRYPAYKPSGVEWLGDVPEHWTVTRAKALLLRNDGGVWGEDFDDDGVIVLRSTEQTVDGSWNIVEPAKRRLSAIEYAASRLHEGDLVVTKSSGSALHIGKTSIVTREVAALNCCFSNFMQRLRVKQEAEPRFMWYVLNGELGRKQFDYYSSTTTGLANLNGSIIGNVGMAVPPLPEQRAIAAFLDRETARIDGLIAKKQRQIELFQEKRAALISHAVTKGLDPNAPMKDSGIEWLGKIPEHWGVMALKYSLAARGGAIKTGPFGSQLLASDMAGGAVKVYNQRNVLDRDFSAGENYIGEGKYEELKSFTVFPQDVLITTRGTIGRCALLPDDAEVGILHPCLMRIQSNPSVVLPEYIGLLIQDSGVVTLQLQLMSNATTIDVIYSESLKSVRLPLPSVSEQRKILTHVKQEVGQLATLMDRIEESITHIREYRTALISAAVTGKIDVREEGNLTPSRQAAKETAS